MQSFDIHSLTVWHRLRDLTGAGIPAAARAQLQDNTFFVATCMREFAISTAPGESLQQYADNGLERLHGQAAYAFLLRTVTGLNSSIPGETNVQGQVRTAWDNWRGAAGAVRVNALNPLMHRLFADSRDIRSRYLQGIGGHSYGSLTRKLLDPNNDATILLVGAGELARSVAPFFRNYKTALWNRHAADSLLTGTDFAFAPEAADEAAAWATHVIMTTPPDNDNDAMWARNLRTSPQVESVVHLGLRRACRGNWQAVAGCHDLDDVIAFRHNQNSLRARKLLQARTACDSVALACSAASTAVKAVA